MIAALLISFLILASPPVYDSEAAYNKTNSASKETRRRSQISRSTKKTKLTKKTKRKTRRYRRRNPNRNKQKYRLKTRRKAGGTYNRRKTSRATTFNNKQVNKRTTNKVRKTQVQHQHIQSIQKKTQSSKGKRSARSPVHLTPLQKQMLMLQMEVLLRDPEMGHIYRQILDNKK